jgi:signal transduction histidine kinase
LIIMFSSLTNRIFFASAALAILCISTAIYVVNVSVTRSAEAELERALRQTGAVVDQQRATVSDLFAVLARFVDQHSNLKAAVATDDPPTVQPIAADYQREANADLLLVTDRSGRVLANLARNAAADPIFASLPTVRDALAGRESSMFWLRPDGVAQVVSVPITVGAAPPEIVGSFSLAFLLNDELAARFKTLTGSEIAFTAGGRVVASTLPLPAREALAPLIGKQGTSSIWVKGNQYAALVRPLAPSRRASLFGGTAAMPNVRGEARQDEPVPAAIILRSRTEQLRFLRPIQTALVATGVVAVLLAIVLGYWIARTITRPLAAITATMREMAATGDLTRKIAWRQRRWEDEDARLLARTFNTLTASVTRFQREAADRERLSALGRLSTVIAHEVRNPLMIIKASLLPLTRGSASPGQISEAAQDIGGEVTRLNRLVNEVLDFARPLRFEFTPTDVNRLCEDSAAAASADRSSPAIRADLDPSLQPAITDGERLRSALVNILVNARHAVAANPARQAQGNAVPTGAAALPELSSVQPGVPSEVPPPGTDAAGRAEPDVELKTLVLPGGRFAIVVRDRGIGIAAEDLPRIFEPYFTTKRTGTGLGLAIARNIVEGLGGTITVASQQGVGTEIRIELPMREAPQG